MVQTRVANLRYTVPGHRVSTRQRWSDEWGEVPYLYCTSLIDQAAPGYGQATFEYEYGRHLRPGLTYWDIYPPLSLLGLFVKVELLDDEDEVAFTWVGLIQDVDDGQAGREPPVEETGLGVQNFVASGLLYELDKPAMRIRSSVVEKDADPEVRIGRAIPFNAGGGRGTLVDDRLVGNCAKSEGEKETRIFSKDLNPDNAEPWLLRHALEYLLAYHIPLDSADDPAIEWRLEWDGEGDLDQLEMEIPPLEYEGSTTLQVLLQLLDRRRLLGFRAYYDTEANVMAVAVFSFAEEPLELEDNQTLPANENQITLDYSSAHSVEEALVFTGSSQKADQVRMIGGRRGAIFSLSYVDETLDAAWSGEDQVDYNSAAIGEPGYFDLDNSYKIIRNKNYRAKDNLRHVYRTFRVPADWDGKVGDGEGGATVKNAVDPEITDVGEPDLETQQPYWLPGWTFERALPLLRYHDYSGDKLGGIDGTAEPDDNTPDGTTAGPLAPICAVKLPDDGSESDRWAFVEQINDTSHEARLATTSHRYSGTLYMGPGTEININIHGAPQHVIAPTEFIAADSTDEPAELEWQDFIVTVYCLTDSIFEAVYPAQIPIELIGPIRVFNIELKERLRLDWVSPDTVVGIEDQQLIRTESGGFVNDDRYLLQNMARMAYAWYGTERKSFRLTVKQLSAAVQIGQLIYAVGPEDDQESVNSVVTSIAWDLQNARMTITTQYGELDLA